MQIAADDRDAALYRFERARGLIADSAHLAVILGCSAKWLEHYLGGRRCDEGCGTDGQEDAHLPGTFG